MVSSWRTLILAAAVLAVVVAGAGMATAAVTRSETRVETAAGDGDSGVHIWINGKEIKPGDPIDLGAGGGSIRIEARSSKGGGANVAPEAIPGAPGEAYLGVIANPLEGKAREEIEAHKGVLVGTVLRGSPAAKAGIEAGDVIAEVGGKAIETPQELVDRVREQKPGTETKVVFYREGKRVEKTVTLGVRPGSEPVPALPAPKAAAPEAFMGLALAPVTKEIAQMAGTEHGALISSLPDESPAAKAGLAPGDVVVSIGEKEVGSPDDLIRLVGEHKPGDVVKVVYFRMGKKGTVEVKLGARPVERGQPDMGIPDDVLRSMPELRQFLDQMRQGLEGRAGRPNLVIPPAPAVPPAAEPYGVGKDIGKILERLDKIEKRLDQLEKKK